MTTQNDPKCLISDQNVILVNRRTDLPTNGLTQGHVPNDRTNPLRNGLTCQPIIDQLADRQTDAPQQDGKQ